MGSVTPLGTQKRPLVSFIFDIRLRSCGDGLVASAVPKVVEVMRRDFVTIDADEPLIKAASLFSETDADVLIVLSGGKVLGVLTERNLQPSASSWSRPSRAPSSSRWATAGQTSSRASNPTRRSG
jgi:CBS-domain-containing membrane protein